MRARLGPRPLNYIARREVLPYAGLHVEGIDLHLLQDPRVVLQNWTPGSGQALVVKHLLCLITVLTAWRPLFMQSDLHKQDHSYLSVRHSSVECLLAAGGILVTTGPAPGHPGGPFDGHRPAPAPT